MADYDFSGISKADDSKSSGYDFSGIAKVKEKGETVFSNRPSAGPLPLTTFAIAKAAPLAERMALEVATNPAIPKVAATIGRVVGGAAPTVVGAVEAGPFGAFAGAAHTARGAWAGGKTGWFTGKLTQEMAEPVANALTKVAPYVQTLTTLSGAQSVLDLAQMADPDRKDIGVLGIGKTVNVPGAHPALINMIYGKVSDAIKTMIDAGLSKADAISAVLQIAQPKGQQ